MLRSLKHLFESVEPDLSNSMGTFIYYPYALLSKKKNNLEENILNGSVKMSDTFNLYYTMLYLCPVNQHQHLYQSTFLTHGLL